jgi:hypothetical protein
MARSLRGRRGGEDARNERPQPEQRPVGVRKSAGTSAGFERHDVARMIEYLLLLLSLVGSVVRDREALVAENLLLRHQLEVLTRPTRKRPVSAPATSSSGSWFARCAAAIGVGTWSWSDLRV